MRLNDPKHPGQPLAIAGGIQSSRYKQHAKLYWRCRCLEGIMLWNLTRICPFCGSKDVHYSQRYDSFEKIVPYFCCVPSVVTIAMNAIIISYSIGR
jgi:hypothetical protein